MEKMARPNPMKTEQPYNDPHDIRLPNNKITNQVTNNFRRKQPVT